MPKRLGAFRVVPGQMSQIHRDKGEGERELIKQRMRVQLGLSLEEFKRRQKRHYPSFFLRQRLYPKLQSGVRRTVRYVTADRSREKLQNFFFDEWLRVPDHVRIHLPRFCTANS